MQYYMKKFYPLIKVALLKKALQIAVGYIGKTTEDLLHHKWFKNRKRKKETHSVPRWWMSSLWKVSGPVLAKIQEYELQNAIGKLMNFIDVTLNFETSSYHVYLKDNEIIFVDKESNHPSSIQNQ